MPGRKFVSGEEYRFGFNGKEDDRDWGTQNIQDYGFRLYNPSIGKFLSVDPLAPEYPELTCYQFASNTPIQAIDLDGLEAYFVHGTGQTQKPGYMTWWDSQAPEAKSLIGPLFKNTQDYDHQWSGGLSNHDRIQGGLALADEVMKTRIGGEQITLVGHSHGGNVAIVAANELIYNYNIKPEEINLVLFNTPRRSDTNDGEVTTKDGEPYRLYVPHEDVNTYALNAHFDWVQTAGEQHLTTSWSSSWIVDYQIDWNFTFYDQLDDYSNIDFGNHIGPAKWNLSVWQEEFENEIKENRKDLYP